MEKTQFVHKIWIGLIALCLSALLIDIFLFVENLRIERKIRVLEKLVGG